MEKRSELVGRACKLVKKDGFVLYGTVQEIYKNGVYFKTDQYSSYIAWEAIDTLVER